MSVKCELIFKVGFEGEGASLFRYQSADRTETFGVQFSSEILLDSMDEKEAEQTKAEQEAAAQERYSSFDTALAALGHEALILGCPLFVHPCFRKRIRAAYDKEAAASKDLLGERNRQRWRDALSDVSSPPDQSFAERGNYQPERVDVVPNKKMTAFKQKARQHQCEWRVRNNLPIGTHPMRPMAGRACRPLGSRLDLEFARQEMKNFLSEEARQAVQHRVSLSNKEKHQTLDMDRLYCDLLSSMPMCFNLFGWSHEQKNLALTTLRGLWPDTPGTVSSVQFEWSPGRTDEQYLGNRSAFDVAFHLKLHDGRTGALGIETKYHEHAQREEIPKNHKLERYVTVTNKSGIFKNDALRSILGTDLQQIWLDHLLALSMLQHPSQEWGWAKFVLVCPEQNVSFIDATKRYAECLSDATTFDVKTIESLLDAHILPPEMAAAFRDRYLW